MIWLYRISCNQAYTTIVFQYVHCVMMEVSVEPSKVRLRSSTTATVDYICMTGVVCVCVIDSSKAPEVTIL